MGYNSRIGTLRDGEKLRYAKEAALTVVRQLKDQDLVGVIAFDSQPHEIAPLQPLRENRAAARGAHPAPGRERRHRLLRRAGLGARPAARLARHPPPHHPAHRRRHQPRRAGRVSSPHPRARRRQHQRQHHPHRRQHREPEAAAGSLAARPAASSTTSRTPQTLPDLMLRETTRALTPLAQGSEQYYPAAHRRRARRCRASTSSSCRRWPATPTRSRRTAPTCCCASPAWSAATRCSPSGTTASGASRPSPPARPTMPSSGSAGPSSPSSGRSSRTGRRASTPTTRSPSTRSRADGVTEIAVRTFGPTADGAVLLARLRIDDDVTREIDLAPRQPRLFTRQPARRRRPAATR